MPLRLKDHWEITKTESRQKLQSLYMKNMHLHVKEMNNQLQLKGRLTGDNIKVIQIRLKTLFNFSEQLIIDLTGLSRIEPEGIYKLQRLKAEAKEMDKKLFLMSVRNKRVEKSFRTLDLQELLDIAV